MKTRLRRRWPRPDPALLLTIIVPATLNTNPVQAGPDGPSGFDNITPTALLSGPELVSGDLTSTSGQPKVYVYESPPHPDGGPEVGAMLPDEVPAARARLRLSGTRRESRVQPPALDVHQLSLNYATQRFVRSFGHALPTDELQRLVRDESTSAILDWLDNAGLEVHPELRSSLHDEPNLSALVHSSLGRGREAEANELLRREDRTGDVRQATQDYGVSELDATKLVLNHDALAILNLHLEAHDPYFAGVEVVASPQVYATLSTTASDTKYLADAIDAVELTGEVRIEQAEVSLDSLTTAVRNLLDEPERPQFDAWIDEDEGTLVLQSPDNDAIVRWLDAVAERLVPASVLSRIRVHAAPLGFQQRQGTVDCEQKET